MMEYYPISEISNHYLESGNDHIFEIKTENPGAQLSFYDISCFILKLI